jgi:hypothetical protein
MTRSRVSGRSRSRAPNARATALPTAAVAGPANAERRQIGTRIHQFDKHFGASLNRKTG